ncbi:protein of unknown function [Taphrina deformans PYCC 5710]|uniref:Thioesterase domain-containing protein n=1 Tax=Taphrina deformans (strain PYCC 5710 / ATCC 11124 / CBS 356.35 / IMI 108563 / JCM 9778 / NBRC 8474) TaxID=1097556 RepID=R4XEG6_TAPDE|nr:protein of unknown function [Taphrina deformans PYCC 5710]|eukprot:CCG84057.1 protein of unknown function [Taphrina deformans PYCC 5710]
MEPHLLRSLSIDSASPGLVTANLKIEGHHCNRLNILHGGVLACLVDTGGSLAVASRGLYSTGVSTDLSVTYLKSAGKIGDSVTCRFICDSLGKTLAYTRVEFMNEQGQMVARGSHTKFIAIARTHEENCLEELKTDVKKQESGREGAWSIPA